MLHHCSRYSFCQNYHQCDGLLCLRLVWTYNRNITLHFTYLRMQQVLERKRQAKKKKKSGEGRGRRSERHHQKKRGIILPRHRGIHLSHGGSPPRTCSIWSQGGTLCGQKGNKDYAAGTGGAGDDLPQLHGSQRCSQAL